MAAQDERSEDEAWEAARKAFQLADTDGNGVLSFDEFERAFLEQFMEQENGRQAAGGVGQSTAGPTEEPEERGQTPEEDRILEEHRRRLQQQVAAERELSRHGLVSRSHAENGVMQLSSQPHQASEIHRDLEKALAVQALELDNERALTLQLLRDMSQRMKEVMVLLPEAKERAVVELYRQVKKLELSRQSHHEASAALQGIKVQMARRVESMQAAVTQDRQQMSAELAAAKEQVAAVSGEVKRLKESMLVEASMLHERARAAEEALEEERRHMPRVIEELVQRGVAEGLSTARARILEEGQAEHAKQVDMMRKISELEEQRQQQQRALMGAESRLHDQRLEQERKLEEQQERWRIHVVEERAGIVKQLEDAMREKTQLAQTLAKQESERRQPPDAHLRSHLLDDLGLAHLSQIEAGVQELTHLLQLCVAAADATSRETLSERSFLLHSVRALGERGRQLVLEKEQLQHEKQEYVAVLLAAGLHSEHTTNNKSSAQSNAPVSVTAPLPVDRTERNHVLAYEATGLRSDSPRVLNTRQVHEGVSRGGPPPLGALGGCNKGQVSSSCGSLSRSVLFPEQPVQHGKEHRASLL